ncbi:hypothetical protein PV721_26645 [Streptomyces sp. MB09-01]|uniref:hypothetical protein n=1 Tax=Streptomyces sp. MB09-01 TaxID=3028666 RepID=UPI0029BDD601|nr:hypothetical protein [Streptomyces sp. MB09-01]MDX3537872.1 hypothetical protein [Streptomyces sp. MB09-01]
MTETRVHAEAAAAARLRIWGLDVELRGFASAEIAELGETFAGSLRPLPGSGTGSGSLDAEADLVLIREGAVSLPLVGHRRPRHRGGSPSARKFFLDGSRFRAEEQHRDISVIHERPGFDVYAEGPARVRVRGATVTISCTGPLPPLLLADIVEDRLLCHIRTVPAVQAHCAAWVENGRATLIIGDSGAGKTTALFTAMRGGAAFLSNDRAFLRLRNGRVEVRSFPLPVNVGCGTIRSLGLKLPHHDLDDHDKIRLRPVEVAERFGADCEGWYPVGRVLIRNRAELDRNIYWDEDDCHPFWIRSWHPGPLPADFRKQLSRALETIVVTAVPTTR